MNRAPLEKAEEDCRRIGRLLAGQMPKGWGFTLILFTFGENGCTTYISNAQRESMVKAMRELIEKIEQGKDIL